MEKPDEKDDVADNVHSIDEAEDVAEDVGKPTESERLAAEAEEFKKKYLYLRADFDNFRKQVVRERDQMEKFGVERTIRHFLSIFDNLERASIVELTPETIPQYRNGINLIVSLFKKTLDEMGVESVDSIGKPFDPNIHEALSQAVDETKDSGVVLHELRKAFRLNGKVIRPAQVVVNDLSEKKGTP